METWEAMALAGGAAFAACAGCTGWIVRRAGDRWLVDHPNERSLHVRPVSRGGGVAIAAGVAAGFAVAAWAGAPAPELGWAVAGAALVGAVSFADDVRGVSPGIRLVVHFAAASCLVLGGFACERIVLPGVVLELGREGGAAFSVLLVVWSVNLFNFLDGIDGYAAGMAAMGFTTLAALCANGGAGVLGAAALAAGASSLGFLLYNFPPAKIFMGDLGSTLLGFLCAAAMLTGERAASVPLWVSGLVFSPFIVDATLTLARRTLAGKRPWRAHGRHFCQRLVRLGWGHRRTVLWGYALMLACAVSATLGRDAPAPAQAGLLCGWGGVYAAIVVGIVGLERRAAARGAHGTPMAGAGRPER